MVAHTQRQVGLCELKASLVDIASSRIVRATYQRDSVSKINKFYNHFLIESFKYL